MYERTREQSISYVGSQENSHSLQIGAMTLATTATVIMFGYTENTMLKGLIQDVLNSL